MTLGEKNWEWRMFWTNCQLLCNYSLKYKLTPVVLTILNSANFTDRVIFRVNSWQIHPTPKLFNTIVTCDFCKKNSRSDNLFILFSAPQKVLVYVLDLRHFAHDRRTDRQSFWFLGVYTIWLMMVLTKTLVIVPPWGAAFCSGHNEVGGCLRIPGRNQHWRGDLGDKLHNRGDQTLVIGVILFMVKTRTGNI